MRRRVARAPPKPSVEGVGIRAGHQVSHDRSIHQGSVADHTQQHSILGMLFFPPNRQNFQLPNQVPVGILEPDQSFPTIASLKRVVARRIIGVPPKRTEPIGHRSNALLLKLSELLKAIRDQLERRLLGLFIQILLESPELYMHVLERVSHSGRICS